MAGGIEDEGPYLITNPAHAAVAVSAAQYGLRQALVPRLLIAFGLLGIALLVSVLWFGERALRELLYLKAAMLVSVAIGFLRNEKSASPAGILGALNNGLAGQTGGGFVTCCCARFAIDGTTFLANAGHPSPYADGSEVQVDPGLPLGIVAGVEYSETW